MPAFSRTAARGIAPGARRVRARPRSGGRPRSPRSARGSRAAGVGLERLHLCERRAAAPTGPRHRHDLVAALAQHAGRRASRGSRSRRSRGASRRLRPGTREAPAVLERARSRRTRTRRQASPRAPFAPRPPTVTVSAATFARVTPASRGASSKIRATSSTCTTPIVARPPSSSVQLLARGRQPPELVDHGLRLGPVVLYRARPVDDPEPHQGEVEAVAARVQLETQLRVDLREVGEVALAPVGGVGADLAAQVGPVHVQRAAVDERGCRRPARSRERLGHHAAGRPGSSARCSPGRRSRAGGSPGRPADARGRSPLAISASTAVASRMSAVSTRAPRASSPASCSRAVTRQLSASTSSWPSSSASSREPRTEVARAEDEQPHGPALLRSSRRSGRAEPRCGCPPRGGRDPRAARRGTAGGA